MIFDKKDIIVQILDVVSLNESQYNRLNTKRNYCALSFRLSADTQIIVNDKNYYVRSNSISFFPNMVDYKRISTHDNLIAIHFNILNYFTNEFECFTTENPEIFQKFFEEILECWNKKAIGYKYRCNSILYRILEECHKENKIRTIYDPKIQKSIDYLFQNYKNPNLTLKELSDCSFISEVYFRKLFKESFGMTPQKYIIKLRIKNAINLINTNCYLLKEIAELSGFNDYKHFSLEFKKETGVPPSKYIYKFS